MFSINYCLHALLLLDTWLLVAEAEARERRCFRLGVRVNTANAPDQGTPRRRHVDVRTADFCHRRTLEPTIINRFTSFLLFVRRYFLVRASPSSSLILGIWRLPLRVLDLSSFFMASCRQSHISPLPSFYFFLIYFFLSRFIYLNHLSHAHRIAFNPFLFSAENFLIIFTFDCLFTVLIRFLFMNLFHVKAASSWWWGMHFAQFIFSMLRNFLEFYAFEV